MNDIIKILVIAILGLIALKMALGLIAWLIGKVAFLAVIGGAGYLTYKVLTAPKRTGSIDQI